MGRSYTGRGISRRIENVSLAEQADFIDKMIEKLESGKWGKGSHLSDDGEMCIEGAALEVMGDLEDGVRVPSDGNEGLEELLLGAPLVVCVVGNAAIETIREVIAAEMGLTKVSPLDWGDTNPIPAFNDADDTTKEKVLAKLREIVEEIRVKSGEPSEILEADVHTVWTENMAASA